MNRYSLRKDPKYDTHWIALPNNGGEVGDMSDTACELNRLLGNYEVAVDERDTAIAERDAAQAENQILRSNKLSDPLLEVTLKQIIAERDEARREAERWRDCFQTGMSLQPKAPSQIFPWETNQND